MNRRRFLGAAGIVAGTTLAGCLGVLERPGESPTESTGSVTKWTYPRESADSVSSDFGVFARSPSRMLQLDDDLELDLEAALAGRTSFVWGDVDPADVDRQIEVEPVRTGSRPYYRVYTGSFDTDVARSALAEAASEESESYEGFDVYPGVRGSIATSDAELVYAVGEGAVVQSGGVLGADGSTAQIRRVVDAATGASETVVDVHAGLATAASRLEPGVTTTLEAADPSQSTDVTTGRFDGMTAAGAVGTIDGGSIDTRLVHVFESSEALEAAPIDEYVSSLSSRNRLEGASRSVDGTVLTVTGSIDAATMLGG